MERAKMKVCRTCNIAKPFEAYNKHPKLTGGYRNQCKACKKEYWKAYQKSPNGKRVMKNNRLKYEYGINEDKYNEIFTAQGGCCAICKTHQTSLPISLAVDHDHKTGEVRGLLCGNCNRGIGYLQDTAEVLESATNYLLKHKNKLKLVPNGR